jgi:UDP-glucose 4-epimerase
MKIAVFGGSGFIGLAAVSRLLKDGHELRLLLRPRPKYASELTDDRIEVVYGDLSSLHDVSQTIEGVDVVLHLVSSTFPQSSNDDPIFDVRTNLVATLQLLNEMVVKKIGKIVFISSGGTVYGNPMTVPIDETHPTEPLVSYGIIKLAIEKYLLMFQKAHGIKANILRVANPYGERQRLENAQGAVRVFLHKAILNEPIEIWGDGSVTRDYLHVKDVAEAILCAVKYNGPESIFNISSGVGVSLNEMITVLESALGREIIRHYLPGRSFDVPVSVLDNALARQELGWEPSIKFKDGIAKTAEWVRNEVGLQDAAK